MGLQVSQDHAFQRREWTAQRIGWSLMALLVLAGLVGLLGGPGPLSWATARESDGSLQVEYKRLSHLEADDVVTVTLAPQAVTDDSVDVELASSWVRSMDITGITPEPQEHVAIPYGLRLTFGTEPGAGLTVQIAFRATEFGGIDGGVRFDGETVAFDQFIYP